MTAPTNVRSIGRLAGVSHVTVLRVLKNERWVSDATRRRVEEVLAKTGYRPNPLLSAALAQRRSADRLSCSTTIAYLNCHANQKLWESAPSQTRFLAGACARAGELGFNVEHFRLFERGMTPRRIEQILKTRAITGVIVGSFLSAHAHLSIDWRAFAAVAQGFSLVKPLLHRTANDYLDSMNIGIRALRRCGYRRIGLAVSAEIETRCQHGFFSGLAIYQQHIPKSDLIPLLHTTFKYKDEVSRWLRRYRPDAILTPHLQALDTLRRLGWRVPEDIAVAHTDWDASYEGWAGVDHRVENAGSAAVDVIVSQLFKNQRGLPPIPTVVLTRGQWIDGPSVRKVGPPAPLPRLWRSAMLRE